MSESRKNEAKWKRLEETLKTMEFEDPRTWPSIGVDCLFERRDGFRFYGARTGDYVHARLYRTLTPLSHIARFAPVRDLGVTLIAHNRSDRYGRRIRELR